MLSVDLKLGRNLVRTFLDYYKLSGYVSSKPSSGLNPKPGRYPNTRPDRKDSVGRASSEPLRPDER